VDPKVRQSLLDWLDGMISQCAEKSALDQRFKRLHKFLTEYSEFVKRPEADEHLWKDLLLSNELDAFEREALLEAQTAKFLRNMLHVVNPPNPNAGKELYRIAYGPWWKRLFR
jgi:hypothetical protein